MATPTAQPVNVMIVSNTLSAGGAERFSAGLLQRLSPRRVRTHLVLLRPEITYDMPPDTPVDILDYHRPADLPKAVWRLRRCIRRHRPDLILGAATSVNVVIGLSLVLMKHRPAWVAAMDTNLERADLRLRRMMLKPLLPLADCIVAMSAGMRRQLAAAMPALAARIVHRSYPVDFQRIRNAARQPAQWVRPPGVPLIVTAGRAHPVKRWDILLEAFARVVRQRPAQLALCGDGPQLNRLKDLARQLKIDDHVHFLGYCLNPFAITAQADLFVLSSEAEGSPIALIEAQGLGCCAVATRCAFGPDEIIDHGRTGLLTAVNDPDALARAMSTLLADDAARDRMGARAKEKVRRQFDHRRCHDQWEALILEVAAGSFSP